MTSRTVRGLTILLACQLSGEVLARALSLPVPGPVLGLAALFGGLVLAGRLDRSGPDRIAAGGIGGASDGLLGILGLLFVPAGVGIVQHLGLIGSYGIALGLALLGSTIATLGATVGVFLLVKRLVRQAGGGEAAP